VTEYAPLSPQQRELIDNSRRHPGAAAKYHGMSVFRLVGELVEEALRAAFADLANRHPALRTTIAETGGELRQRIAPPGASPLRTGDRDTGSAEELCRRVMDERYGIEEVLAGRPLFDARLHRLPSGTFLTVRIHHLVFDGVSLLIIWRDLGACYAARLGGHAADLPALPTTAYAYARETAAMPDTARAAAVDFYRPLLGTGDGTLRWPAPPTPYAGNPTDVGGVSHLLDPGRAAAVRRLSREHRVSPFLALVGATAAAVAEVCAAGEVLIGVDTANRELVGPDVVGFFLNTKLLCATSPAHRPVGDVIRELRTPWLASAAHAAVYYDAVLAALGKTDVLKVNMPSQSQNWSLWEQPLRLAGLTVTEEPTPVPRTTWRDISIPWLIEDGSYRCLTTYRLAAVTEETVRQLLTLIDAALVDGVEAPPC
jgi:hypothetical protein